MTLSASDFPRYFEATHGHAPFAWQRRLLDRVLAQGWDSPIDLPTASGKTAVLDIAVFALALQADDPARRTPRRIVLVVDRRIVVDDAFARAQRIRNAIDRALDRQRQADAVLAKVRERLLLLGGEIPLDCAALRGGLYREDRWARTPLQPVLLCSTVDQIGSRLLHRGYGLSPRACPIHAGLLGQDTLIVLDEAHCARPFLETLSAVGRFRCEARESLPGPWAFVPMTATPPPGGPLPFRLEETERAEPLIARRLQAAKPARLIVARGKGDEGLADAIVSELTAPDNKCVARGLTTLVVVNRVRAARLIFDELRRRTESSARKRSAFGGVALLLTGRSRPLERDRLLQTHRERLMAGRDRRQCEEEPPLVVVATQCIEVGADLDADALVTEACPLDSLRQRFGRLDRLGQRGRSPALVVCRPEYADESSKEVDPVYGDRLHLTWRWLKSQAIGEVIDCGVAALDRLAPPVASLSAPSPSAPLMFPAYCDLWVQTSPPPSVSPDPAIFLHGPGSGPPEVGLVWRADLHPQQWQTWAATVALCPPLAGEILPLPLHQARAWLAGKAADPGYDIEGAPAEAEDLPSAMVSRRGLRWLGPEDSVVIDRPENLRPGDVLVVACTAGGADVFGWTGRARDLPSDLGLQGRVAARRPALLRLHPSLTAACWGEQMPAGWQELAELVPDTEDGMPDERVLAEAVASRLRTWSGAATDPALRQSLEALIADGRRVRISPHPSGEGLVVAGRRRLGAQALDFSDEDDLSNLSPQGLVGLDCHLRDVRDWAQRIAARVRLPEHLVDALARAGHLHDVGKVDPRFQAWLVGGDRLKVVRERPLAKSDRIRVGAQAQEARRRSGYPAGARHELLSVRMAESAPDLLPEEPLLRDLVLHLVASHHGHCRPWAPVVRDDRPLTLRHSHAGRELVASTDTGLERLDSGVAERFWRLIRHFGWWGLSYLEACLRLADHRASEQPGTEDAP